MTRKIKVFIIEDDPMVLSINKMFFTRLTDFEVVGTAGRGEEGLEKIKSLEVNLIVLDIYLPDINGLDIAKEIRKRDMSIDIIMITAASDSNTISQSLRLGVVDYLIKPYNYERFSDAMKKFSSRFFRLKEEHLDQDSVDKITNSENIQEVTLKGISENTLQLVKNYMLNSEGETTAEQLSSAINMSRITARRYLEYLVNIGYLSIRNEYHKIGRPEKIYILEKDK